MPSDRAEPLTRTLNVFLSSTVKDFKKLRQDVRDALSRRAETACFLSEEDWSGGYDDTVAKCVLRVQQANGFVLLLGYWYGSVPPGSNRSITHIEFDAAMKKWGELKFPPMAVLMPTSPSPADKQLRKAADGILKEIALDATEHKQRLDQFHTAVTGSWRTVTRFKDKHDLREAAIVSCLRWRGQTPLAAARGAVAAGVAVPGPSHVSDEQFGSLGRRLQLDAVETALSEVTDHASVPAIALMVHGDEDGGQRPFLLRLIKTVLKPYRPGRVARLPLGGQDLSVLVSWVAQAVGIIGAGPLTPAELAYAMAVRLRSGPLCVVLDRIADMKGGAEAFRNEFWVPLYATLRQLREAQPFSHRLVMIVADYSDDHATIDVPPLGQVTDYTKLLPLPRLGQFDRLDVLRWLGELNVPDEPAGRRAQLADRALRNDRGAVDAVPTRVFERLRGETLWPEGEQP